MAIAIDPDLVLAQALYHSGNIESWSYLREMEAFDRAVRQQPSNPALLDAFVFELTESGYLQEALGIAERFVELDPLSPVANSFLANALYALGRTSEAEAALEFADQLGSNQAKWAIGAVNLVKKQDDIAIAHFEANLEQNGFPSNWVRELVTGARDPATGQAYLDRRLPKIVASFSEENTYFWQANMTTWYLFFGFLDRYFELVLELDLTDSRWTDADVFVWTGTIYRRLGFTAHPKYLDVAEAIGLIDVWEQRGAPDFCEKVEGAWACE